LIVSDQKRLELLVESIEAQEFGAAMVRYGKRLEKLVWERLAAD